MLTWKLYAMFGEKKMKGKKRSEVYYRSKKIRYVVDTEVLCSGEAKLT